MTIECLSALTLATNDMPAAAAFYRAMGFEQAWGGPECGFTVFRGGASFLNLTPAEGRRLAWWGRAIFWVDDVDAYHRRALEAGYRPLAEPQDAPWGERCFAILDPDGHEIVFARRLDRR